MYKKICIIGEGLTALMLAKVLLDLNLKIDLVNQNIFSKKKNQTRTVAISSNNFSFLKKQEIISAKKNSSWKINKINIFNSKFNKSKKVLDFKKKGDVPIFYMIKNNHLFLKLKSRIKTNPLLKILTTKQILKKLNSKKIKNNYSLIINCSSSNFISKKFFFKTIKKKYQSTAITTIIKHKFFLNDVASQHFTEVGPIAFLPIAKNYTSVVWSIDLNKKMSKNFLNDKFIKGEILRLFNNKCKNTTFSLFNKFNLNFLVPRNYYNKNILIFGDALHQVHPLAGQGLNMTIRDIKNLKLIIEKKINLGLQIDQSVLIEFSKKIKSYNFLFLNSINFIEKYFSINNYNFNKLSEFLLDKINKNSLLKNFIIDSADKGIENTVE